MAGRQTAFNLLIVRLLRKLVRGLEDSLKDTADEVLSTRQKQQELEDQIGELRMVIDESHRELKGEIEALKRLVASLGDMGSEKDDRS